MSRILLGWGPTVPQCRWGWQSSPRMRSQILQKKGKIWHGKVQYIFWTSIPNTQMISAYMINATQFNSWHLPWSDILLTVLPETEISWPASTQHAQLKIYIYVSRRTTLQLVFLN
jgi:hypothetical protein